jgi:hypothetical protein
MCYLGWTFVGAGVLVFAICAGVALVRHVWRG